LKDVPARGQKFLGRSNWVQVRKKKKAGVGSSEERHFEGLRAKKGVTTRWRG